MPQATGANGLTHAAIGLARTVKSLGVPVKDGPGLEPQGVVGAGAAGGAGAVAGAAPGGETLGAAAGVPGVGQGLRPPAVPAGARGAAAGLPAAVVEPLPAGLLPGRGGAA